MAKYNGKRNSSGGNKKKLDTNEPKKQKESDGLVLEGVVVEALRGRFRIEISQNEGLTHQVLATLAGKLRRFGIKIVPGDVVNVELSPYDITRGRIVYRLKK